MINYGFELSVHFCRIYIQNETERLLCSKSSRHFSTNIINSEGSESKFTEKRAVLILTSNIRATFKWITDAERWFNVLAQVIHFEKNEFLTRNLSFVWVYRVIVTRLLVELTPNNMFLHRKVQGLKCLAKIYYRKHMTRDDILGCKRKTDRQGERERARKIKKYIYFGQKRNG